MDRKERLWRCSCEMIDVINSSLLVCDVYYLLWVRWPHTDVEKECEMLAKMGYSGVKLFPAQEQLMSMETFDNNLNPWYFAYQPVSYRLQVSRIVYE